MPTIQKLLTTTLERLPPLLLSLYGRCPIHSSYNLFFWSKIAKKNPSKIAQFRSLRICSLHTKKFWLLFYIAYMVGARSTLWIVCSYGQKMYQMVISKRDLIIDGNKFCQMVKIAARDGVRTWDLPILIQSTNPILFRWRN